MNFKVITFYVGAFSGIMGIALFLANYQDAPEFMLMGIFNLLLSHIVESK